jgi:hypothetical protein
LESSDDARDNAADEEENDKCLDWVMQGGCKGVVEEGRAPFLL